MSDFKKKKHSDENLLQSSTKRKRTELNVNQKLLRQNTKPFCVLLLCSSKLGRFFNEGNKMNNFPSFVPKSQLPYNESAISFHHDSLFIHDMFLLSCFNNVMFLQGFHRKRSIVIS